MRSLREWRRLRGLTIDQVAAQANLNRTTLIESELGPTPPHPGTIGRLCAVLHMEAAEVREFAGPFPERAAARAYHGRTTVGIEPVAEIMALQRRVAELERFCGQLAFENAALKQTASADRARRAGS